MASNLKRSLGAGIGHSLWFIVIGSNRADAVTHRRFASGDLEKTASIKLLAARLTARAASDTFRHGEKGRLKFLYPHRRDAAQLGRGLTRKETRL
jgi:hypothetical protein